MDTFCCLTLVAMLVSLTLETCRGLRCFSCYAVGGHGCTQYQPYEDSLVGKGDPDLVKNCSAPYDKACIIERFEGIGGTLSHIRDCSDNKRFSFTNMKANGTDVKYDRLTDLHLNNETACMWNGYQHICLSKCDTDFCNGPQINVTAINTASAPVLSSFALVFNVLIVVSHLLE